MIVYFLLSMYKRAGELAKVLFHRPNITLAEVERLRE